MRLRVIDWTEWVLIPATALLLAALHRLELLVIVVPASLAAAYLASAVIPDDNSHQRKI